MVAMATMRASSAPLWALIPALLCAAAPAQDADDPWVGRSGDTYVLRSALLQRLDARFAPLVLEELILEALVLEEAEAAGVAVPALEDMLSDYSTLLQDIGRSYGYAVIGRNCGSWPTWRTSEATSRRRASHTAPRSGG